MLVGQWASCSCAKAELRLIGGAVRRVVCEAIARARVCVCSFGESIGGYGQRCSECSGSCWWWMWQWR